MQIDIPNAIKYKLWTKRQWRSTAEGLQRDNKILLDRIAELEAREPLCRCADEVRCDYLKRIEALEAKK